MTLTGNSRELSLADLIVVATQDPRTHRFTLSGPAGDGLLLIEGGRIVHATYGDLAPLDAAHVLVTEQSVDFEIETDAEIPGHTINVGAQELLMEAMRRLDEGLLKRPRQVSIEIGEAESRKPPRPRSHEAKKSPEAEALRRAMGRVLFADAAAAEVEVKSSAPKIVAAVIGIALLVTGSLFAWRAGWLVVEEHRDPVNISDLNGPRDVVPALLSGMPPPAPEDRPVLPTILCRVLLDTRGSVYEVRVFQPRSGLDAFEEAAIAAVKLYRFSPARREGVAVPVWIIWPVDFVRAPRVADTMEPVPASLFRASRDRLPTLLEGQPPETPFPERRLRPKIACRLLIDHQGNVIEAEVVDPRDELELYERIALDTVKNYRFTVGEREGVPVAAWIPWSVSFQ
ncbi:MAG: DUF4388 domain-containing protein [Acidobacteria bacterium]|nr:MAG: DUF4388 domain-containing protein [Acidobacteriota bacterium]